MIKNTVDNPKLKAGTFKMRFLEAGVVQYENEMVLIRPENLMTIAQKFNGAKIIIDHQEVNEANAAQEIVGYASNIRQEADSWAWCDFTVNDEEATELINKGFKPSCAYLPVATGSGGTKNNVPYDREIIDIVEDDTVTHIAIVENPRYEDAIILKNSIKNKMKNIFRLTSKKEIKENSVKEIDADNYFLQVNDQEMAMEEAVRRLENEVEREKKEKEEANVKVKANDDQEIEVAGKMMKISEMVKKLEASLKNEEDEEKKNAEDEEKKNAEDEKEKEKEKKEAKKNSADAEKISKIKEVFENGTKVSKAKIITDSDRFALGAAAYGEPQKITK